MLFFVLGYFPHTNQIYLARNDGGKQNIYNIYCRIMLMPILTSTVLPSCHSSIFLGTLIVHTVHACVYMCFCGTACACLRQRYGLVCRPQIYGALTLAEESTFSWPAGTQTKEAAFTLFSHSSWPLTPSLWCTSMCHFYLYSQITPQPTIHTLISPSVRLFFRFFLFCPIPCVALIKVAVVIL